MGDGYSPETMAAQALGTIDQASGAVSPPIHPSTIYELNADGTSLLSSVAMGACSSPPAAI